VGGMAQAQERFSVVYAAHHGRVLGFRAAR
jgi:hypothetical protein